MTQPRSQMEQSLIGRQHTSMAHCISYKPYMSWWQHTRSVAWQALGYTAVIVALIFVMVGFGDLS